MAQNNLIKVFVYGTLKKGLPNHHYLTNQLYGIGKFFVNGETKNKFPLIIATRYNIPFLLDRPGHGNKVIGEIYEVDDEMLSHLDVLEDYPNLYDRRHEEIVTEKGSHSCLVYLLNKFPEKLLELPCLAEYIPPPDRPYLEKSKRTENISAKDDLNSDL